MNERQSLESEFSDVLITEVFERIKNGNTNPIIIHDKDNEINIFNLKLTNPN